MRTGSAINAENMDKSNTTEEIPWLYDISLDDTNWIITSSFMIFTMQTGFGMLESGCVSIKNEVNIMMKNVVDIVLGGLTYWMFGYAFSFGRSRLNNPFIACGDFLIDPDITDPMKGAVYAAFIFQLSFATTATTIVSGAMAERCNFKAYCIFSFWNTLIYCIPAGWVWGTHGFLKQLGAVDIAGSGPVHLIGGSAATAAAIMLGPRLGRYDDGIAPLPLGSPVNAVMGLFVLWWGWLAFNSGSTYGLSGVKWQFAARAAVMTMISSFGGGTVSLFYSMILADGRIEVIAIINGILGSLVSITAGCFLYTVFAPSLVFAAAILFAYNGFLCIFSATANNNLNYDSSFALAWEALIIGSIGSFLACVTMPLFDKLGIDDPVGASSVHGVCGVWGVLAVGIFADNPAPLTTTNGLKGLIHGGGWYLLGVQALTCICLVTWGMLSCMVLLFLINKIVMIRMEVHHELLGADLTEHHIKHGQVGVSRALSALRPVLDTSNVENIVEIGLNPGHDTNLKSLKIMTTKRRYKLSRMLRDITKNRNFGINLAKNLFPRKSQEKKKKKSVDIQSAMILKRRSQVSPRPTISLLPDGMYPPPMTWLD